MHPVDIAVGRRIRAVRTINGLTQTQLGAQIGTKFQQVQKYESGTNRVSASRLFEIAQALNVRVGDFFEEVEAGEAVSIESIDPAMPSAGRYATREAQEFLESYFRLSDEPRRRLLDLARSFAEAA